MQTYRHEFRVHGLESIYCAEQLRDAFDRLPGVSSYVLFKRAYAEVVAPAGMGVERLQAVAAQAGYRLQPLSVANRHGKTSPL